MCLGVAIGKNEIVSDGDFAVSPLQRVWTTDLRLNRG